MTATHLLILGGFALITFIGATLINTLIGRKNQVEFAFASLDTQLQKRFDLIPNLVAVAERYMGYEQGVLADLTRLRSEVRPTGGNGHDLELLDQQTGRFMSNFFAVAENYPLLRACEPFLHLQASLNEVEEQLAAARRAYNAAVTDYNNGCEMVPLNMVAGCLGYKRKEWLRIPDEERLPVKVWR